MDNKVLGIHHITAIAGPAQRNYDFYSKILGLRFVKKTVNFDDPGTYHFYFGNETGTPGTILTFFPWAMAQPGRLGTGLATEIGYSVPPHSLDFWKERFEKNNVKFNPESELFGEKYLGFEDPDGLKLKLVVPEKEDERKPWITNGVKEESATKGFNSITLTVQKTEPTAKILTDIFGYEFKQKENNVYRYSTTAIKTASVVDLVEEPDQRPGLVSVGINHHVAFRVSNEEVLMQVREKVLSSGLHATPKIDRNYFFSVYFREPGGVLFELATDNPGFAVDEEVAELGTHLKLPAQYESRRSVIQKILDPLNT